MHNDVIAHHLHQAVEHQRHQAINEHIARMNQPK